MKYRVLSKTLMKAVKTFPALVVTGPRQSGKTTLLRSLFGKTHRYVSLENPDVRVRAKEDPNGFLENNKPPLIIDEIQYVPELLSYVKTKIDEDRKPGRWLFTGSQNFVLMRGVTQSLAGRAAILSLLPFSYSEKLGTAEESLQVQKWLKAIDKDDKGASRKDDLADFILRGGYPEMAVHRTVDRQLWCGSYIATYLERDVRNLLNIGDLTHFEKFLKLCAVRTGRIINISELARDVGVSVPTANRWLSILEAGYQVLLLYPYDSNYGKRMVKSPKLYFCDTAIASYLLGLHGKEELVNNPAFDNLFETMVVNEFLKRYMNFGQMPSMYYLRTRDGLEIDLVIEIARKLYLFEVKNTMTVLPKHAGSLVKIKREFQKAVSSAGIISKTKDNFRLCNGIENYSWEKIFNI
jgi:predicted AAA+ superfamily ATPase